MSKKLSQARSVDKRADSFFRQKTCDCHAGLGRGSVSQAQVAPPRFQAAAKPYYLTIKVAGLSNSSMSSECASIGGRTRLFRDFA